MAKKKTDTATEGDEEILERDDDERDVDADDAGDESDDDDSGDDDDADDDDVVDAEYDEEDESDDEAEGELAEDGTPTNLGTEKYVHAAFFAGGIGIAYLAGKLLLALWNRLAEWPAAVRSVPFLLRYAEDERPTFTMSAGAVIGIITVIQIYRREQVRSWADEVASELSKVHWPDKQTVTNGTIVVIVASAIATVYIALLDRFWSFVTNLVYGA